MCAFIYIDGFNLHYMRLQRQPHFQWLDLASLGRQLLGASVGPARVNFYTARLSTRVDRTAPRDQQVYLNALSTVPEVHVHFGHFLFSEKYAFLASPPQAIPTAYRWNLPPPRLVKTVKAEEKGSDVNLASHLVRDAFLDSFDLALVVSNDTDLVEPIRIAVQEAGKVVGIVAPRRAKRGEAPIPSPPLRKAATFVKDIDDHQLAAAQFPAQVIRADGSIVERPLNWA